MLTIHHAIAPVLVILLIPSHTHLLGQVHGSAGLGVRRVGGLECWRVVCRGVSVVGAFRGVGGVQSAICVCLSLELVESLSTGEMRRG